jgi:hypothetical protein
VPAAVEHDADAGVPEERRERLRVHGAERSREA